MVSLLALVPMRLSVHATVLDDGAVEARAIVSAQILSRDTIERDTYAELLLDEAAFDEAMSLAESYGEDSFLTTGPASNLVRISQVLIGSSVHRASAVPPSAADIPPTLRRLPAC